jgi:hypothetical protein
MYCSLYEVPQAEIEHLLANPEQAGDPLWTSRHQSVSLEKAWHGLDFLLSSVAGEQGGPLSLLLDGGEALGRADLRDSPGNRLLGPDETRRLDAALSRLTEEALWTASIRRG